MIILFGTTVFLILLYLIYPLWLKCFNSDYLEKETDSEEIKRVSLILLSYNGIQYLTEKIEFLQKELKVFDDFELIIIDDCSGDGSAEWLKSLEENDQLKILFNTEHRGIPYSMNRGVSLSKFDHLIFCDQRQTLSENALKKIVEPLKNKTVGAVSGCISRFDNNHNCSFIRRQENYLKKLESKSGNLIGVYGPMYAINKCCYSPIPENIILDDLYLSLQILKTKQVLLREDCPIVDENFYQLYNFNRTFRYMKGFIQIINDRLLLRNLNHKHLIMLLWHKYLRLLIPILLLTDYIILGVLSYGNEVYLTLFIGITILAMISILPSFSRRQIICSNCVLMIIYNIAAWACILVNIPSKRKQIIHRSNE